jgi:two-component sensor histidine kinase
MLVFALVALPPTLMGVMEAVQAARVHAERLRESVQNYAALASTYQHALVENSTNLLLDISRNKDLFRENGTPNASQCTQILAQAIRPFPLYASLVVLGPDGVPICGSDPSHLPKTAAQTEYFRRAVNTKAAFLSGYVVESDPAVPTLILAQPVLTDSNAVRAVLALAIRLEGLDASDRFLSLPLHGVVYLIDRNGVMLHGATVPAELGDNGLPADLAVPSIGFGGSSTFEASGKDGVARIYAISALESGSLSLLVGVPTHSGMGWIDSDLVTQILLVLAIWISGVLAAWLGTRLLVTRWTERLFEMTSAFSKGNLLARADLSDAPVEIRQLGDTLAAMAARLNSRQDELKAALQQKDMMLREIHHRIKNNLQTVTSLLNLFSRGNGADPAARSLREVRIRVQALALVHRHLYENPDHQVVHAQALLGELCQLIQLGSAAKTRVAVMCDAAAIDIEVDRAVPLALLVTELVTDAIHHSFPKDLTGTVSVRLDTTGDHDAELTVCDSAAAPSESAFSEDGQTPRLSTSLIQGFAAQLRGEIGTGNAKVSIKFPLVVHEPSRSTSRADDAADEEGRSFR